MKMSIYIILSCKKGKTSRNCVMANNFIQYNEYKNYKHQLTRDFIQYQYSVKSY